MRQGDTVGSHLTSCVTWDQLVPQTLILIDQMRRLNPGSQSQPEPELSYQLGGICLNHLFMHEAEAGCTNISGRHMVGEQICRPDSSEAPWQKDEPDKNALLVNCCQIQTHS